MTFVGQGTAAGQVLSWDGTKLVWSATAGGLWTDAGAFLHPTAGAGEDVVVGAVTQLGTEKFRVTGGAFLADGAVGTTPTAFGGVRMMWIQGRRGAFRAGEVTGAQWNDLSIGDRSFAGGLDTTASGDQSTALGNGCTASGDNSLALVNGSSAAADNSGAIGRTTQANAADTFAIGLLARVDAGADSSIAIGEEARVFSGFSSIALGDAVEVRSSSALATGSQSQTLLRGERSHSAGRFAVAGDAQATTLLWRIQTTDATANVEMFLDGGVGSERAVLADDTSWTFEIQVVARKTNGVHVSMGFFTKGVIQRDTGVATTALQGALIPQVINAAVGWTITIDADTVNGALRIRVTGAAGDDINWVATARMTVTTGGT